MECVSFKPFACQHGLKATRSGIKSFVRSHTRTLRIYFPCTKFRHVHHSIRSCFIRTLKISIGKNKKCSMDSIIIINNTKNIRSKERQEKEKMFKIFSVFLATLVPKHFHLISISVSIRTQIH